jgi:hypothetical protein
MAIVQLERLCKKKKFGDLIRNETCDLLACSIIPQQTTLLRAPLNTITVFYTLSVIASSTLLKPFLGPFETLMHGAIIPVFPRYINF